MNLGRVREAPKFYKPSPTACADVKSVIELLAFIELQLLDNESIESLQSDLQPETLYSSEMLKALTTIHRNARDCSVVNGVPCNLHAKIRTISRGLLEIFHTDESNRDLARSLDQKYCS